MNIKKGILALTLLCVIGTTTACKKESSSETTIKVAASATPHAQILEAAREVLKEKGYTLSVTIFDDYIQPNLVVDSNEFDANYFQHIPYLNDFNQKQGTSLQVAGKIHYEIFGVYPGKKTDLNSLSKGDVIAIPNDSSNEARALLLLQDYGIIRLKEGASLEATVKDIVENPYEIEIKEIEAAQLARIRQEVAFVVLNGNYALAAGLYASKDAVAIESSDSKEARNYVNVIAVNEGKENSDKIQALVQALSSETVQQYIKDTYDGSVIYYEE